MVNFRKLRQDYPPLILKEGRGLYENGSVKGAKILSLKPDAMRILAEIAGAFSHTYTCEMEIDKNQSVAIDTDCDCSAKFDCAHQAALIFYLEQNLDELVAGLSEEGGLSLNGRVDQEDRQKLQEEILEAKKQSTTRRGQKIQKELVEEYIKASSILATNPFFLPEEKQPPDKAEIAILFKDEKWVEIQLALRFPFRSKPLHILNLPEFLEACRYEQPFYLGNKRYFFNNESFDKHSSALLKELLSSLRFPEMKGEKIQRVGILDPDRFGTLLALAYRLKRSEEAMFPGGEQEGDQGVMPRLYLGDFESPLRWSQTSASFRFELEYLISSAPKIMLKPQILLEGGKTVGMEEVNLYESESPGMIHENTYYPFSKNLKRAHLQRMADFRDLTIPEPLFGTFVENVFPELQRYAKVAPREVIERFATLPFVKQMGAECDISYLEGEFEASLHFIYDTIKVPHASSRLEAEQIMKFVTPQGILARNLAEEAKIVESLFQDFIFDPSQSVFKAKSDKKVVEFMTEVIPRLKDRVAFNCPQNLLERFIYDDTTFEISLEDGSKLDTYFVNLKVKGSLKGTSLEQLWECLTSRRPYIELTHKKGGKNSGLPKILVLNLDRIAPLVHAFDEIGLPLMEDVKQARPLWSLAGLDATLFEGLPVTFSISEKLAKLQKQIRGETAIDPDPVPSSVLADLRPYQVEGIQWLSKLRKMHLGGILADDMGLGKTLQAIAALTQHHEAYPGSPSIVVCPTSLVYNWKEEIHKFNPKLKVLAIDGTPTQRKKLHAEILNHDVLITSYSLLQKDVELYKDIPFSYSILDEAQYIKNRGTRNAKSVKMLKSSHKLILSGTPIENSLDELWSLFDFLMPGLLSTYERFVEKFVRYPQNGSASPSMSQSELLKKKVSPFILRRMKEEVLDELPPVSEIIYRCALSETQKELYTSYAASAREELVKLVKENGFEKLQIHVLATLTRLKQICCHPALFAKEQPEPGDSAKYDMLLDLIQTLVGSKKRVVIFSQYTKMLQIMRQDLEKLAIPFEYLDGSSKNRLNIVKRFNEDVRIPLFLVSLKAGGAGLNLVGADTVIHYDLWWNPAVENQATDRVHRIGQKKSVSSYKLITMDSIEEKILELQNRKQELVRSVISCDEEAMGKLTWDEVLELLQT